MTKDEELISLLRDGEWWRTVVRGANPSSFSQDLTDVARLAADRLEALAQPVVGVEGRAAHEYATELREIAGMLAQAPDGPIRWKQYRLAEIADWIAALAASPSPVVGDREAIGRVVAAWRAVNNEFGTMFVDEDGPFREIRDMDAAVEGLSAL